MKNKNASFPVFSSGGVTGSPLGVLVTRPEPGLSETMEAVKAAGWCPYASPALEITSYAVASLRRPPAALLLTSGQAIAAARDAFSADMPVYAVGDRTAARAKNAGFTTVFSAGGDATALAALVVSHLGPTKGTLLLLSGAGQGMGLVSQLRQAGFAVVRRVAYRAYPVRRIAPEVQQALVEGLVRYTLFFSAESAKSWISALPTTLKAQATQTTALVMSDAAAEVAKKAGWQTTRVAPHPNAADLLGLLGTPGQGEA
ncbi:uroporphyrinogen-III synthase [Acetobacter indonesiensis]|uniref:uroporphyrinogen-III synthase n=1 Tax=Acetobacter indonesiensis TaxID=104101 RepID=UPI00211AC198|nr:uroporphyrinogen-III synthase [Acetobacter indonesiensis]